MEALERFLAPYPSRSYKKGEMILSIDEKPSHGFAIREGIIKTYNIDSQGNEHPVTLDVKNDFFPLGWIQGHIDLTLYFYEAFTNCTVTCFDRDELKSAMQNDAQLTSEIYFRVSERFLDLQQRIEALEQSRAAHKIIFTLRFLCSRFGRELTEQTVDLMLPITQQDLANFIGLTRETTAIELKRLEQEAVISYTHQHYIVHMPRLTELIEQA